MFDNIIQLNENLIKTELKSLVKQSIEDTLDTLLNQEVAELTNAAKYERSNPRNAYHSGNFSSEEYPYIFVDGI